MPTFAQNWMFGRAEKTRDAFQAASLEEHRVRLELIKAKARKAAENLFDLRHPGVDRSQWSSNSSVLGSLDPTANVADSGLDLRMNSSASRGNFADFALPPGPNPPISHNLLCLVI